MPNKKGVAWPIFLEFVLGAIILFLIIALFFPNLIPYPSKIWNLTKSALDKHEGEFKLYEEELTKEEKTVRNSVNALVCAINSVTVGEFGYDNSEVCPKEGLITTSSETPTGKIVGMVTKNNKNEKVSYEGVRISCEGIASEFLELAKQRQEIIEQIANAVKVCLNKGKEATLENEFTRCAYFDPSYATTYEMRREAITGTDIIRHLNQQGETDAAKSLDFNKLAGIPSNHEGCIYYNKNLWPRRDTIIIDDCTEDNPVDTFSCSVEDFELPQDISLAKEFIQALGDPHWLVYYEKFPEEAQAYWHKEWTDMFNLYTIGFVTVSGVLNVGFAGKAGKVATTAGKEAVERTAKEAVEKATKEAVETSSEYLLKRARKASLKNIIRSVAIEGDSQMIYGVGKKTAEAVGDIVTDKMGKKAGKEAFEKVEKEIYENVLDIVKKNVKKMDPSFTGTINEYRENVAQLIVRGGTSSDGTIIKGAKEIFEKRITTELTQQILEKQTYRQFFQKLFKEGTQQLDEKLLEDAAEKSLKRLVALDAIDKGLVEKSFKKGAEKVGRILLQGTFGIKEGDDILTIVKKQLPIAFPSTKWLKYTGPGYFLVLGGKTLAIGVPKWVVDHPLPSALLLSLYIDAVDAANDKTIPVGINSIATTPPSLLGAKKTNDLVKESTKYFIRNQIKPGNAMYFVSPCKVNIKVFKRKCECANNPEASVFNFGGGLMNVDHGTITLKEYEEIEEINKKKWTESENIRKRYPEIEGYLKSEYESIEESFNKYVVSSSINPLTVPKNALNFLTDYVDYNNAAKQCYDRQLVKDIFNYGKKFGYGLLETYYWLPWISKPTDEQWEKAFKADYNFYVDCIELETDRISGYCYDYFPRTEWIRNGVTILSIVADAVIIGFTGGLATPIALVGSGMAFVATDVLLENFEKWP